MIRLKKDGRDMEARNEVQASAFINKGWEIDNTSEEVSADEHFIEKNPDEIKEPARRGRKPKAE